MFIFFNKKNTWKFFSSPNIFFAKDYIQWLNKFVSNVFYFVIFFLFDHIRQRNISPLIVSLFFQFSNFNRLGDELFHHQFFIIFRIQAIGNGKFRHQLFFILTFWRQKWQSPIFFNCLFNLLVTKIFVSKFVFSFNYYFNLLVFFTLTYYYYITLTCSFSTTSKNRSPIQSKSR